jgi:hypothetical protein
MPSSSPSRLVGIGEWFFRGAAMRQARSRVVKPSGPQERALNQARMLVEVARRVAEPVEALPQGSRPAVLCGLYRDSVYFALSAEQSVLGDGPPPDLAALWAATPPEKLLKLAGDEATLAAVRNALVDRPLAAALDATEEDAARARAFAEALLWEADAPIRAVEGVHVQRWMRLAVLAAIVLVAAFGVRTLLQGPNLARDKKFKLSSVAPECAPPNKCADLLFHTQQQENPWADFDLGSVVAVERVEVTNRSDCCAERAIPLIVELSLDDKKWTQVARRDAAFSSWTAKFPKQKARFVRVRAPRNTILNLDDVIVR